MEQGPPGGKDTVVEQVRRQLQALQRALDADDLLAADAIATQLAEAVPSLSEQQKRSLGALKRVLDRLCLIVAERREAAGTELARISRNGKALGRYRDASASRQRTRLDSRA